MLSVSCQYAIHAMIYLAQHGAEGDRYIPIRRIADDLRISFHFLSKILQAVTQAGLLSSYRGPRGGVLLARPAATIRIVDIVNCLDGDALFADCLLGFVECTDECPCPLHSAWVRERTRLHRMFSRLTLAELADAAG